MTTSLGNEYRTTLLCVDRYGPEVFSARLYNPYLPTGMAVDGLVHFLLAMDHLLDQMKLPQSFTARRTFCAETCPPAVRPPSGEGDGVLATFELTLHFRQNTTWQGALTRRGEEKPLPFASALELVAILHRKLSDIA